MERSQERGIDAQRRAAAGTIAIDAAAGLERRRVGRSAVRVTTLGAGGSPLGNQYGTVEDGAARGTIDAAYAAGVRYFDTAPRYGYGLSERRFGDALRRHPREDFVLSSKVGVLLRPRAGAADRGDMFVDPLPFAQRYDYSYDGVMRSFEDSLQRLGLARIDMLLVHNLDAQVHGEKALPGLFRTAMEGAHNALDGLRSGGAIAAFGLGVNRWEVCGAALEEGDFDCFLLGGLYTLVTQAPLESLLSNCAARGVSIVCGAPYHGGLLAPRPSGAAPALSPETVDRARRIREVCERHAVPVAAAALQFPLAHPAVVTVIPGARSAAEQIENVALAGHAIPADLWRELKAEGLLRADAPTP